MTDLDKVLEELSKQINNEPSVKEYLSLKKIIEADPELKKMRLEIARLTNEEKKKEHDNLLEVYNSHPLMVNYYQAREEVINLLKEIKNILDK